MVEAEETRERDGNDDGSFIGEIVKFAVIALIIIYPIRAFVAQPYIVLGESMSPTFEEREYLIVDRLSYRFEEPSRGEVIVFYFPQSQKNPPERFIKRIIGLPGETMEFVDGELFVTSPGGGRFQYLEPYIKRKSGDTLVRKLGPDEYFVAGDNRPSSSDSRIWGAINKSHIIGRAYLRLFPISRVSYLPGDADRTSGGGEK